MIGQIFNSRVLLAGIIAVLAVHSDVFAQGRESGILIAEFVDNVRNQFIDMMNRSKPTQLTLSVDKITFELQVGLERKAGVGVKVYVFEAGADIKNIVVQKISFEAKLTDTGPIKIKAPGRSFPGSRDLWFEAGQERLNQSLATRLNSRPAKNIILIIGSGMGSSAVTAARIFDGQERGTSGEESFLAWEKFPHVAISKTYSVNRQVAEAASSATALLSGVKVQAGVIGVDSSAIRGDCESIQGHKAQTAIEFAEIIGMSTGVVTTARLSHATPAASYAHSPDRNFEDDGKLAKAWKDPTGCKDIARQLIEFPYGDGIEVAMGGGRRHFQPKTMKDAENPKKKGKRKDGRDLSKEWVKKYEKKGSTYVWNQKQFDAIDPKKTNALLGLFNYSHMQYEADRKKKDKGSEPSLAEMTSKAIDILSKNPKGFFLLVESGRIEHANRANNAYRMLTEISELSNTVKVVLDKTNPDDTLIIVTGDYSDNLNFSGRIARGNPILGLARGIDRESGLPTGRAVLASDKMPYTSLSYASGPGAWKEGTSRPDVTHVDTQSSGYIQQAMAGAQRARPSGADVAIWAKGPGAHLFQGTVEQNFVFHVYDYAASLRVRAAAAMAR